MPISDAAIEGVAGAIGAVISLSATYPLLTVSTLRALNHKEVQAGFVELAVHSKRLPSPLREIVEHTRSKGWKALFAGLKPAVVATAASQGIYFYIYSILRQIAVAHKKSGQRARSDPKSINSSVRDEDISVTASMLVAGLAGCANVLATNPIWVVITQMQALQKESAEVAREASVAKVARGIYTQAGLAGFYKGLGPSLVMVVNPTVQYIMYEWLAAYALALRRRATAAGGQAARLRVTDVFLVSAAAKIGATLLTYPMLVIKNRLQSINRHTVADMQYRGVMHAVDCILRGEGLQGFYKGMGVKMVQTVLAAALLMTLKEEVYNATSALLRQQPRQHIAAARLKAG